MSTIINQVYASAPIDYVIIDTLELICSAWPESLRLVMGYEDLVLGTEDGRTVEFTAAPMTIEYPKKSNEPNQTLKFAIDNVTGQAQRYIDMAVEAELMVTLIFRRYLNTDLSMPSEPPFKATALGGGVRGSTVSINAGYRDLLNYSWPRNTYNLNLTPGLKYL